MTIILILFLLGSIYPNLLKLILYNRQFHLLLSQLLILSQKTYSDNLQCGVHRNLYTIFAYIYIFLVFGFFFLNPTHLSCSIFYFQCASTQTVTNENQLDFYILMSYAYVFGYKTVQYNQINLL